MQNILVPYPMWEIIGQNNVDVFLSVSNDIGYKYRTKMDIYLI